MNAAHPDWTNAVDVPSRRTMSDAGIAERILGKTRQTLKMCLDNGELGREWASSLKRFAEDAAREYEDRFLVELIQNGYDAHRRGSFGGKIEVLLDVTEGDHGVLYVANTGRAFTDDNFKAITGIAQSSKPPGEGIGNKGVGFKSVLQVTDWPEVYSTPGHYGDDSVFDGYSFRFARREDIAGLVDAADLDDAVGALSSLALPIPIARGPTRLAEFRSGGFCTVIRLPLRDARATTRSEHEIHHLINSECPILLFLDRIASLRLRIEHPEPADSLDTVLIRDSTPIPGCGAESAPDLAEVDLGDQGKFVVATRVVAARDLKTAIAESSSDIDSRWQSWSDDATVSVAVQRDSLDTSWSFYTFLPMSKAPSALAAHVNAPFFTKLDRNSVSFGVHFNDFLLTEIAALCVDAARWIRSHAPALGVLCVDLICWSSGYARWLARAFTERGLDLGTAELIPIVPREQQVFGAVTAVRVWGPFHTEPATLTAQNLSAGTDAILVDPILGTARTARFRALRSCLNYLDDGSPKDDEIAGWIEATARALNTRRRVATPDEWMELYDDIALVYDGRDPDILSRRRLLVDSQNQLRRFSSAATASKQTARTAFFYPVRNRTAGEEDVEVSVNLDPPPELRKGLWFTRPDLDWYARDGSQRPARVFFEKARLVRRYDTQDVLEAVGKFVRAHQRDESVLRAALLFAFALRDRAQAGKALKTVHLQVPTHAGWRPATDALFSEDWAGTQGESLARLVALTAPVSADLAELRDRLVVDPNQWIPKSTAISEWTEFLRRIGVRDGLHPVARQSFSSQGDTFTPPAWARTAGIENADFVEAWRGRSPRPYGCLEHPRLEYRSASELWCIPGQFEFQYFLPEAKELYARLVLNNLGTWPAGCRNVSVRVDKRPKEQPPDWPTPLALFLDTESWVPVKTDDGPTQFIPPDSAWYFDDDAQQAGTPPFFAPVILRRYRRMLRDDPTAIRRLREWCGVRCWNSPDDAGAVIRALSEMLTESRVTDEQRPALGREYEAALGRCLARNENPWGPNNPASSIVVRRGEFVDAIDLESDHGPIYVEADSDSASAGVIRDLGGTIACARVADGPRLFELLAGLSGAEARLLADVDVVVRADGVPVTDTTGGIPLVDAKTTWLVPLVIAAMEFRGSRFRHYGDNQLRAAARQIHAVQLVAADRIDLEVDGNQPISAPGLRGVFAAMNLARPYVIVKDLNDVIDTPTLERLTGPLAAIAGAPEIGPVLFEAIAWLGRNDHGLFEPTADQCADALGITVSQFNVACNLLGTPMDVLRERLPVIAACLHSTATGHELQELLENAHDEEDVLAALRRFALPDPAELMETARRVSDYQELRDEIAMSYKDFNAALTAMGRRSLANPAAHDQSFAYFLTTHRDAVLSRLRDRFMAAFQRGDDLSDYVGLRKLSVGRDPRWIDDVEVPSESMMIATLNNWLASAGAATLETEVQQQSIDHLRIENRKVITACGETAGAVVRAWASRAATSCPDVWNSHAAGGRLADWADEQGLMDFVLLQDLQPLVAHLVRAGSWPTGMPETLKPEQLALTDDDLAGYRSDEDRERIQRELARTSVSIGNRRVSTDPDMFAHVAEMIRTTMRPGLMQTPFRVADLGRPPAGRPSGPAMASEFSVYRNNSRQLNEGQRAIVGLSAEVIALDWLVAQYKDAEVLWRSGYRDKVLGGAEGNDLLGYDIEVVTASHTYYFEVKGAAGDGTEFELTPREIDAARRNTSRDKYRIIYVRYVCEPSETSVLLLPNPFAQKGSDVYQYRGSGLHYWFAPGKTT